MRDEIAETPGRVSTLSDFAAQSITDNDGWSLYCETDGVDLRPGMSVEYWGRGIGYTVRGVAVGGHVFWYRTEAEQEAADAEMFRRLDDEKRARFEAKRAELDALFDGLPAAFRERIERFRAASPDFRWRYEAYELGVCVDAAKVVEWARSPRVWAELGVPGPMAAVDRFAETPELQRRVGVADGHSGNSFGAVCCLARAAMLADQAVVDSPGALAPLAGEDYT